jgi:hypothetical protein
MAAISFWLDQNQGAAIGHRLLDYRLNRAWFDVDAYIESSTFTVGF